MPCSAGEHYEDLLAGRHEWMSEQDALDILTTASLVETSGGVFGIKSLEVVAKGPSRKEAEPMGSLPPSEASAFGLKDVGCLPTTHVLLPGPVKGFPANYWSVCALSVRIDSRAASKISRTCTFSRADTGSSIWRSFRMAFTK